MTADPFGTAALRRAVVDAWRSSPTRLREDANLEEDHARGYYRDRVVVELAQNAADAAARAGVPGRVTFRLDTGSEPATLRVTNVGAPLDADGVASLASLRASSKGEGAVGRFGVGFAAVRSVTDDVTLRSSTGGVRFSESLTRAELERDGLDVGRTPAVLRLPFPAPAVDGETVVALVLRDRAAVEAVRAQLDAVDDALLLALPALERVELDVDGVVRVLDGVAERWVTHRAEGDLAGADVAELPVEQRRTAWSMVWALPRASSSLGRVPRVLHAPTPTDVPLTFPAMLVATFPVDPGRRRVLPGAATDRLAAAAGRAYAALLGEVAAERGADVLDLVPTDLPAGEVDAAIREAALDALATTPLLPALAPEPGVWGLGELALPDAEPDPAVDAAPDGVAGGTRSALVAPRDAVLLAGSVGEDEALAAELGTLPLAARHHSLARRLGARVVSLTDVLDERSALPPARWRSVYAALAGHLADPSVREALAGAPVPLADGRTAHGTRGLILPPAGAEADGGLPEGWDVLGLRVVHVAAAHPVLARVGAVEFQPLAVLAEPAVRAAALDAAEALLDEAGADDEAADVVDAVLTLAAHAAGPGTAADLPFWLGELPVAVDDCGSAPLRETALPGTWAARHLDGLAVVVQDDVDRLGTAGLLAAGAHAALDVYRVGETLTGEPEDDHDPESAAAWLADWSDYLRHLADLWGSDVLISDLEAIADLDAVADDSWPQALALVAEQPDLRRALLTPVRPGPGARPGAASAPSYAAWWLRRRLGAPFALRDGVPLLPPAPPETRGLDDEVLRALGGVGGLDEQRAEDWPAVLDALGSVGSSVPVGDALALWAGLAATAVAADPDDRPHLLDPLPDRLPALHAGDVVVADADDVVVAPGRRWAQLGPVLPAPASSAAALADLLDLPVAGEARPDDAGEPHPLDARVGALDARLPRVWHRHGALRVHGRDVRFWVHDGEAHAVDEAALGDALADLLEAPQRAALLREALREPARAAQVWAAVGWD